MKTLKIRKRFRNTMIAKILNFLYAKTKIVWFDDLWIELCEKYYER